MTQRLSNLLPVVLLTLFLGTLAHAQKLESLNATAKGKGTISTGVDKLRINSVMVVLKENGEADFTFYCDLQLSAKGRWSAKESLDQGVDLEITGGVVSGNASGTGKLFLSQDAKSIDKLNIDAKSTGGRKVTIRFIADK